MIDNLTEAIRYFRQKARNIFLGETFDNYGKLAAWLEELAERREADRWIPVSERLPEYDGNYLVTFGNGFIDTAPYLTLTLGFGLLREVIDENNKCIGEDFDYWDVIAWRPLPEPYTESEATNEANN